MFWVISSNMLNLTNLHCTYTPSIFFLFCVVAGIDEREDPENFNFVFVFCLFVLFFHVLYSDLNFRCFITKNAMWYVATWKTPLTGAKFCDKPPYNVEALFLKLLFTVESKSGIKMLVNILLLDIICPKNATLFIMDQLQGVITSQPTVPPSWKLISLSIFLNDIQLNRKLCSVFWNIAFIWCSYSPQAEYWVHCVENYYWVNANNVQQMVLEEQSCIFRANYL